MANCAFARPPVLDRVDGKTIEKLQASTPMTYLQRPGVSMASAPHSAPQPQSIIKQSTILQKGKNWTLVPVGAVVYTPSALNALVGTRPVGVLLPWSEFLAKNMAWITTTEVSYEQASGSDQLPATRVAFWAKQDKVVVAVHQGGPISAHISYKNQAVTQR